MEKAQKNAEKAQKSKEKVEKYGIEKLQKVLRFGFSLSVAYEKSMEDGIINLSDIPNLIDPMSTIVSAIGAFPEGLKESMDLNEEEKKELETWSLENFDIKNDELEAKIESAFKVVLEICYLVGKFVK